MAKKSVRKNSFLFRDAWLGWLVDADGYEWSPQECKELLFAIRSFRLHLPIQRPSSRFMKDKISACLSEIDETEQDYADKCEINRKKLQSYWDTRNGCIQENTDVNQSIQTDTEEYRCIEKDINKDNNNNISEEIIIKKKNNKKKKDENEVGQEEKGLGSPLVEEGDVEIFQQSLEETYYPGTEPTTDDRGDFSIPRKPTEEDSTADNPKRSPKGHAQGVSSAYLQAKIGDVFTMENGRRAIKRGQRELFLIPNLQEVAAYISEKGYHIDAQTFIDYYENAEPKWTRTDARGKITPVKSWKQCMSTFENHYIMYQGRRNIAQRAIQQSQQAGYQQLNNEEYEEF